MRPLRKNTVWLWYALYEGVLPVRDENGFLTGEEAVTYSDPVRVRGNVSANKGEAETRIFGTNEDYDGVLMPLDQSLPLSETSILWVDAEPYGEDGTPLPHDHTITRVSRSLNVSAYAIKKVQTRGK